MSSANQKQSEAKQSRKSSSLISSSSSSSQSGSQSKYQKKQIQLSKDQKNDTQLGKKNNKKKRSYSSRSRSHSSSSNDRSRSKNKQKKGRSKRSHRDRSRSNHKAKYKTDRNNRNDRISRNDRHDRHDRSERDRDNNANSKYRDDYQNKNRRQNRKDNYYDERRDNNRGRQREKTKNQKKQQPKILPLEIPMPLQVPMPLIPGQRRKRQRSRSPLSYYLKNQNNNEGQFWDSFSWVKRINYTPNVSSSDLVNTKKMRRLMITNVPYQMGIGKDDLRDLITRYMAQNYLKDSMNNCPVRDLQINQEDHSVAVQLSSVEQTCRMCKLQKIQLFKGSINGIIRLGDSCYGNNIVTQAQNAAQAQAAAFAAINVLQNKKTSFNMDVNLNKGPQVSTLIRVTNAVTPYMAGHLTTEQWEQFHQDLIEGFSLFGKIVHNWFVKASQKQICADPGNLFIEYESQQEAIKAMNEMQGRIYDERIIKLFYVPRQIYYPNYKKDLPIPTIKAPPKVQKQNVYANLPAISKSSHIATKSTQ